MSYILDDEGGEEDDTPKSEWKPPPVIPKEDNRTGTNKRTFFVTTERRSLRPRLQLRQNLDKIVLITNSVCIKRRNLMRKPAQYAKTDKGCLMSQTILLLSAVQTYSILVVSDHL